MHVLYSRRAIGLRTDDLHKATVQTFHERYDQMGNRKGGGGDHLEVLDSIKKIVVPMLNFCLAGRCVQCLS